MTFRDACATSSDLKGQANGGESTVISKFSVISSSDGHTLRVKGPSGILRAISGHRKFQLALIEDGQVCL